MDIMGEVVRLLRERREAQKKSHEQLIQAIDSDDSNTISKAKAEVLKCNSQINQTVDDLLHEAGI